MGIEGGRERVEGAWEWRIEGGRERELRVHGNER